MDTQRSEMTQLLNEKTDGFMIDTQLPQEVRDSILEASHAAKPLSAMDWTALPGSDDTVTFNLEPPRHADDEEEDEEEEEVEEEDLPLIEVAPLHEGRATSPLAAIFAADDPLVRVITPPEEASTPCPSRLQPHTSTIDQMLQIIRKEREVQEASLPHSMDADTP